MDAISFNEADQVLGRQLSFGRVELLYERDRKEWRWRCDGIADLRSWSTIGHKAEADAYQAAWFAALRLYWKLFRENRSPAFCPPALGDEGRL